ncbi:hypothetical protein ABPG75_008486 [Micractinium tetrahymenae]
MFRSLAQGHHIAAQQDATATTAGSTGGQQEQCASGSIHLLQAQAETAQADELRHAVCDELLKRRNELYFFIDEDYDAYVTRMRQPRCWGGEPELAVATHVLQRPIAVFTKRAAQLALVSRYGNEEYNGKAEVPLFFHGAGHYDLLVQPYQLAPAAPPPRSRL